MEMSEPRIVCQFSCGAASAVATKLALAQYGDRCEIINAFLKNEHEDNRRFLADCEVWFGRKITVLRDEKYGADIVQVFRRKQFMKGIHGAPCSRELKRKLLDDWKQPGDVMVFGYTANGSSLPEVESMARYTTEAFDALERAVATFGTAASRRGRRRPK